MEDRLVPVELNSGAFRKMKNLRFLKIENFELPKGLNYLSSELRLLDWDSFPLKSLPTGFRPSKLVQLKMHSSRIKQLWEGIKVRFTYVNVYFLPIH